jgi:hypothetical protein
MNAEERVQLALRAAEPVPALRLVVQDLARTGSSKTAIYELLENVLVQLRATGRWMVVSRLASGNW